MPLESFEIQVALEPIHNVNLVLQVASLCHSILKHSIGLYMNLIHIHNYMYNNSDNTQQQKRMVLFLAVTVHNVVQ